MEKEDALNFVELNASLNIVFNGGYMSEKCPVCSKKLYVAKTKDTKTGNVKNVLCCSFCFNEFPYTEEEKKQEMCNNNRVLRFCKVRKEAKAPIRAHKEDAGADLFFCPADNKSVQIAPKHSEILPTGIKVEIPVGYMLEIKNKSGVASKKHLLVGACVCDSFYSGEIFVNLNNVGYDLQTIAPGEKIAQAVLVPIEYCDFEEIQEQELYKDMESTNKRGEGCLGSTGNS